MSPSYGDGGCPFQTMRLDLTGGQLGDSSPIVGDVINSPGQPLDLQTREFMEARFGHDFSKIRVHTDERAALSAAALDAHAYTVGSHIVFAQGLYHPRSSSGRTLVAHELVHAIQQSCAGCGMALQREGGQTSTGSSAPLETVAGRIANLALRVGQMPVQQDLPAQGPVLTVVRDRLSGEIFVGLNTGFPPQLTEAVRSRIEAHRLQISRGQVTVIHTVAPGTHSEINALNQAVLARQQRTGRVVAEAEFSGFELHNVWLAGRARRLTAAPRCEHCGPITRGVTVTQSVFAAESAQVERARASQIPASPVSGRSGSAPSAPAGGVRPGAQETIPQASTARTTATIGTPDMTPVQVGGPSARGIGVGAGVTLGFQGANIILNWVNDEIQRGRVREALTRVEPQIARTRAEDASVGVLLIFYYLQIQGPPESLIQPGAVFVNLEIVVGRTRDEAEDRWRNTPAVRASVGPGRRMSTSMAWIQPRQPTGVSHLRTPFAIVALGTFARGRETLQDVMWGGEFGFDDEGETTLGSLPEGAFEFFILRVPTELIWYYGIEEVSTVPVQDRAAAEGGTVPVVGLDPHLRSFDVSAACVFPADVATDILFSPTPSTKDNLGQIRYVNFGKARWVRPENIRVIRRF